MQREDTYGRFRSRVDARTAATVAAGFAVVAGSVLLPVLSPGPGGFEFSLPMIVPAAIVVLMLVVMVGSLFQLFVSVAVTKAGLVLSRPPFHRHLIPWRNVVSASAVSAEETRRIFEDGIRDHFGAAATGTIAAYARQLRNGSPAFRYVTIAPAVTTASVGERRRLLGARVHINAEMVRLQLIDGNELYLSPAAPEEFLQSVRGNLPAQEQP